MRRRRYLSVISSVLGSASVAGCTGLVSLGDEDENSEYPGGTLVVENTGGAVLNVVITTSSDEYDASLDASVPREETLLQREFVTAERGDIVTLAALLGNEGEPVEFDFLPAGGDREDSPPEVARLTFESSVEASATWSATSRK